MWVSTSVVYLFLFFMAVMAQMLCAVQSSCTLTEYAIPSLVPRLLPSFLSHTVQKTGREPGRFDHVRDDVLCVVLCVVLVIELSPTHTVVALLTVTALDATQDDRKKA